MATNEETKTTWLHRTIQGFLAGVTLDKDSELLEDDETLTLANMVLRNKKVIKDTGYVTYLGQVRGNPRCYHRHVTNVGNVFEFLITNETCYVQVSGQWQYPSDGTATTLSSTEAAGQTALSVTSISGFADNDYIGVKLDTGQMHFSRVNGAPGAGIVTIDDALPSQATTGNALVKAVVLNGDEDYHVVAISVPWNNWIVFTNGINCVKKYDPDLDSVVNIPNLPFANDTVCQTLALYDNSILLFNISTTGNAYPFRYYYCAKGDGTNWSTLEAGYTDILDDTSPIRQALRLGPDMIAYREKGIVRISLSGNSNRRFDSDTMVQGVGVFSQKGVVDFIDKHLVWATDDFYWYKGGYAVESVNKDINDSFFFPAGDFNEEFRTRAFAVKIDQYREVLFIYYPSGGSGVTKAWRYASEYDAWTSRSFAHNLGGSGYMVSGEVDNWDDLINSWSATIGDWASFSSSSSSAKPVLLLAGVNYVAVYDFANPTDAGEQIGAVFETKDFADPNFLTRHDYIDIAVKGGTTTVEVSLDKGASWILMGTVVAGATTTRFRLYKQFVSRHFRYRVTSMDNLAVIFMHIKYLLEYDW